MPMENVWDIIPVLFLTFHLIVTIAASNSHASLYKDVNGTLHVFSTNEHMPFAVNGINIFRAVDGAVKCIQLPCPPYHFRTGCEGHAGAQKTFLREIDMGSVTMLTGSLRVRANQISRINFRQLKHVGGDIDLARNDLAILYFGKIRF
eukprot:gene9058-10347_t